jgi:hypothetical protein
MMTKSTICFIAPLHRLDTPATNDDRVLIQLRCKHDESPFLKLKLESESILLPEYYVTYSRF